MKNIKNITILKVGIICIVISFIANAFYFMNLTLKEPVFLKHYYESDIQKRSVMVLHLITNSGDNREIAEIDFPQLPEDYAYVSLQGWNRNNGYDSIQKFAHFHYKTLVLEFRNSDRDVLSGGNEESVVLDKAKIRYMNGDTQEVDIGKIILHKNLELYKFLDFRSSSSSNNYTSNLYTQSLKNITINNVESNLDNELGGFLVTTVNDINKEDLQFPLSYKNGEYISFDSQFKYDSNDVRKYNVYDLIKKVDIFDSEGNKGYVFILNLDYEPTEMFISEKGIIDYLKYIGVK